jgi:hypothetical protein
MIGIGIPISHSKRPRPIVASSSFQTATRTSALTESSMPARSTGAKTFIRSATGSPARRDHPGHRARHRRGSRVNLQPATVDQTDKHGLPPRRDAGWGGDPTRRMPRPHGESAHALQRHALAKRNDGDGRHLARHTRPPPPRTLDMAAGMFDSLPRLRRRCEPKETWMPLFIWLSACSYWHRVTAEMTRATLQFLEQVEHPPFREAKRSDFGQTDGSTCPDTKMCLRA